MAEDIKPSIKGNNSFDLSIETLDSNSIASIRKILLNAVGWIFDSAQTMFFNAKKIVYVASMLLMIYDAYRYLFGNINERSGFKENYKYLIFD